MVNRAEKVRTMNMSIYPVEYKVRCWDEYEENEYEAYGVTIAENYTEAMSNIESYYGEELIEVKMFMQQEQSVYEIGNNDNEIKINGTITGL